LCIPRSNKVYSGREVTAILATDLGYIVLLPLVNKRNEYINFGYLPKALVLSVGKDIKRFLSS